MKQLELLRKQSQPYGGDLLKKRKGRRHGRPICVNGSMHLVLRSTQATGEQSFTRPKNREKVLGILGKFAKKNGVRLKQVAVARNHLHIHLKLTTRHTYKAFIRATTAAIAMAVSEASRWKRVAKRFWDRRRSGRDGPPTTNTGSNIGGALTASHPATCSFSCVKKGRA